MAVLKFDANIPWTGAFTYAAGKESPSQQFTNPDGTPVIQWFRKTKDGDSVYLSPYVEQELIAMDYRAGEHVTICKRVQGNTTRWEVYRPGESPERPLAGQPIAQRAPARPVNVAQPPRSTTPATVTPTGTAATIMQNCLKTAVDQALWTVEYAKSKGLLLTPEFAAIKEMANTLFIQHSKAGNIRAMHDYAEMRGTDADFAKQGSQAAADAVAQRKIAETRADDAPLPEPTEWLKDENLDFLGDTQRAV